MLKRDHCNIISGKNHNSNESYKFQADNSESPSTLVLKASIEVKGDAHCKR